DGWAALDQAITSFDQAARLDPGFLWAVNDGAFSYDLKAMVELQRGLDPLASVEASLARVRRAKILDPGFLNAYIAEIDAHLAEAGRDRGPRLDLAREAIKAGAELSHDWSGAYHTAAYADWIEASHRIDAGEDPSTSLDRGLRSAGELTRRAPSSPGTDEVL